MRDFSIADGNSKHAFVHLDVSFLEGRPDKTKQSIGNALLEILTTEFCRSNTDLEIQITVEIRDISQQTYFKYPAGSLQY